MDKLHKYRFPNNNDRITSAATQTEIVMPATDQMHAAVLDAPNAPFRLAALAKPVPRPGEVLVRIKASAINPLDLKIHVGQAPHARQPLPAVLGIDLAGVVDAVDAELLAEKPANLSMREAAALPLIFITAWEGLVDRAHLGAGQTVLIHGGAGGVGHIAVQIARAFGANVFATGSAKSLAFIAQLDATPIDYASQSVEDYVGRHTQGRGFDIVFDTL